MFNDQRYYKERSSSIVNKEINQVRALMRVRKTKVAFFKLNRLLRDLPQNAELHFLMGNITEHLGYYQLSRSHYASTLRLSPKDIVHSISYLKALKNLKSYKEMIAYLHHISLEHPESAELKFLEGYAFEKLEQFEQAILHYQSAFVLHQDHQQNLFFYGRLSLNMGKVELSIKLLDHLCHVAPQHEKHWFLYGYALQVDHQKERALKMYRRSLRERSDFAPAHYEIAELVVEARPKLAKKHYLSSLKGVDSKPIAYKKLSSLFLQRGDHVKAYEFLKLYQFYATPTEYINIEDQLKLIKGSL